MRKSVWFRKADPGTTNFFGKILQICPKLKNTLCTLSGDSFKRVIFSLFCLDRHLSFPFSRRLTSCVWTNLCLRGSDWTYIFLVHSMSLFRGFWTTTLGSLNSSVFISFKLKKDEFSTFLRDPTSVQSEHFKSHLWTWAKHLVFL